MRNRMFPVLVSISALIMVVMACGSSPTTTTTQFDATTSASQGISSSSSSAAPKATPTTAAKISLEVGSYTHFTDSIGSLWFVGEVVNNGDAAAGSVDVALSLLDDAGSVAAVGSDTISYIAPNGKYPFHILITSAPPSWTKEKIQIQGTAIGPASFLVPYVALKTDNITGHMSSFGTFQLTGSVSNTGQKTATLVHIAASAYDKDGNVVDVADTYAELNEIAPGADSPFSIDFLNLNKAPASYAVFVDSYSK